MNITPKFSKSIFLFLLIAVCSFSASAQNITWLNSSNSAITWKVKAESDVADMAAINKIGFNTDSWVKATVPGTVFGDYVNAGLEKDPNFGDNIYKIDKSKYNRNFWYRTEFSVPSDYTKEKIWLNFKGINRKADIYLNGIKLGSLDGFMQRGNYDISDMVNKNRANVLSVLVYCPKLPITNYQSPTYISSDGWDWMPSVPGLDMGITDEVYLSNTGTATIIDPWIRTDLPTNGRADLTIKLDVKNSSNDFQQGTVTGVINPGNIQFSQNVFIGANSSASVTFDKRRFSEMMINDPKLWWPNGYGDPNLYTCDFTVKLGDEVSDTKRVTFGIKKYSYDTVGNVLHVYVNGTKVFLKGGNWGMSEYMLRCRGKEYDLKLKYHKEMNFNVVRNWIGSTTDEAFYDACDKYGIMVWDDFWLNSIDNLPNDITTFNSNAVEKIKRFRNHPSIMLWCGDNEGYPHPPLNGWLREDVSAYDGDDRRYQPNSHAGSLTGSGPWTNADLKWYFTKAPSGFGGNQGWGLRSEIGTAVFTNFESFKKFMPKEDWWPRDQMWNKHFFGPSAGNAGPDHYDETITKRYGAPTGIEDYCRKAQLLNIETNKAMYEGWEDNMWEDASGIMTWMSQSAYPSFVWQTYDYYYDLTGAYWGAKKACEPLHIQWNPATNSVKVINTTRKDAEGLTAEGAIYNKDGKIVKEFSHSVQTDAPANAATEAFKFDFPKENLAFHKKVVASSDDRRNMPEFATDGNPGTRWSSRQADNEWIYVDLGSEQEVNGVGLNWEDAYGKEFKIQVSDDAQKWTDVLTSNNGAPGFQTFNFETVGARYVRMQGIHRGTGWGYSLWEFEVYGSIKNNTLSDVHFIKLKLTDKDGKLLSDNFYWRSNNKSDYSTLNSLPHVDLKVSTKVKKVDGKYEIDSRITNPLSSPAVAFAIRVQAVKASNGEEILPVFTNDNYFSLLPGESKDIHIEFDADIIGSDTPKLLVQPYNDPVVVAKN
jgi:hypothetical protein